jgi:tetratricopeptide (TPR) repeat protein
MKTLIALLLFAVFVPLAHSQSAAEEYRAERFREAAELYDRQIESGERNAPLFYNAGNAWYRAGDLGRAILNYERALALEPAHPEARANLQLARDKASALELTRTRADKWIGRIQPSHYTLAAAVAFWVAAFAFAALWLGRRRSRPLVALAAAALLIFAAALAALYRLETGTRGAARAIVTGEKIEARLATADNAGSVLALPPGSEIAILSTRGEWSYAALPNNLRGWIPAASAERVRL